MSRAFDLNADALVSIQTFHRLGADALVSIQTFHRQDSRPAVYETAALPLSYLGLYF